MKRFFQTFLVERRLEAVRVDFRESLCHPFGIAMLTTFRNFRAASDWIPSCVGPFDFSVGHLFYLPSLQKRTYKSAHLVERPFLVFLLGIESLQEVLVIEILFRNEIVEASLVRVEVIFEAD